MKPPFIFVFVDPECHISLITGVVCFTYHIHSIEVVAGNGFYKISPNLKGRENLRVLDLENV